LAIRAHAERNPKLSDMGTTVVLAVCRGDSIHLAHVGDSRAYLIQEGSIRQLTEDHSLVAEMIRTGQLTDDDVPQFLLRNIVTRSLGTQGSVDPDLQSVAWGRGLILLLCSDGLNNMVDDSELLSIISEGGADIASSCRRLIERANQNGGKDNITAVLAYHE